MEEEKKASTSKYANRTLKFDAFFNNFRRLLYESGKTQHELAVALNSGEATITRYMQGVRTPEIEYVYKIAMYFGISMETLLGIDYPMPNEMSKKAWTIGKLYEKASDDDKAVVNFILQKYMEGTS